MTMAGSPIARADEMLRAGKVSECSVLHGTRGLVCLLTVVVLLSQPSACVQGLTDKEKVRRIEKMYASYQKTFPEVPFITVSQLIEVRKKEKIVLVDVRTPEEIKIAAIPGAVPVREFERGMEKYRGRKIVTYCTIGYRSGVYAQKLRKRKIEALNLKGSILLWVHAGGRVVDEKGEQTRRVHVYGRRWNLVPDACEGVW